MKTLGIICFALLFVGCASFPQEKISKVDSLPDVSSFKNKPSVYFDVNFFRGNPDGQTVEVTQVNTEIEKMVEQVVSESNLFNAYSFDEFNKEAFEYHAELNFYNHGGDGAAVSGFISGFTLGIIPGAATDNYTLRVNLKKSGIPVDTFESVDAIRTWIGIWFIPMAGNTPEKAVKSTIENMIRDLLKKLIETNKFEYSFTRETTYPKLFSLVNANANLCEFKS